MNELYLDMIMQTKLFKATLFIPLVIASVIMIPIFIVLSPFIIALVITNILTTPKPTISPIFTYFDNRDNKMDDFNKINDLTLDFNSWFDNGKGKN
jgi:uncharacterized membrane protein (DUF106 family)